MQRRLTKDTFGDNDEIYKSKARRYFEVPILVLGGPSGISGHGSVKTSSLQRLV